MSRQITIPVVVLNLHGPDKNQDNRRKTIRIGLDKAKGGIGGFNEFNKKDWTYLNQQAEQRGLRTYVRGQNVLVYDATKVIKNSITPFRISRGGPTGPNRKKFGPHREVLIGNFTPVQFRKNFEADLTHLMHQAWTRQKWKIPFFNKSVAELSKHITEENGFVFGDMNKDDSKGRIDLVGIDDYTVKTPPTYGKNGNYDQFIVWGDDIFITNVVEFQSPSDHGGLRALLTIREGSGNSSPTPNVTPTAKPKPKPKKRRRYNPKFWRKYGAPVKHPFAKKSPKWKRRHKWKWNKIVAFRRNWRKGN